MSTYEACQEARYKNAMKEDFFLGTLISNCHENLRSIFLLQRRKEAVELILPIPARTRSWHVCIITHIHKSLKAAWN